MLLRFASFNHPDLVHALTTRHGGVSEAPHATLNMAFSRPDAPEAVRENRRRVYTALEIRPERVVQAGQIHSDDVLVVTEEHAGRGALERLSVLPPADALITNRPDLYLLACFADCTPLLFFDPVQRAVGVAHAGWQGTVKQIGAATVRAMTAAFGSQPSDLLVLIGPSVGPCCYNVWPHVAEQIRSALPMQPAALIERDGQTFFDLWQSNVETLVACGVQLDRIEVSRICTVDHASDFFSHRAHNGTTGRFAALIGLRDKEQYGTDAADRA